jgi:outer membrane protein assembly factor BamB
MVGAREHRWDTLVRRRRGAAALIVMLAAVLLSSCVGFTTGATNIIKHPDGSYSAQLNFVGSCDSGEHCSWYVRYRRVGTGAWTRVPATPQGPVAGPTSNVSLSENATGLTAGTQYEYQVCANSQPGNTFVCVGPDGTSSTTTKFTTATDWTQFRYGPEGTGFNPFESTLSPSNVTKLQQRWYARSDASLLASSPVVANGVVYASTSNGMLDAFDAFTGTAKWSYAKDSPNAGSPAVANGVVYDLSENTLYAIDASSGTKLWSTPGPGGPYGSWVVVAAGVVYAASEFGVSAFNATTGAALWKNVSVGADAVPAVSNGVVYTTAGGQSVLGPASLSALDATTGKVLWSAPASYQCVASSPAVANGVVYVVGDDSSFAGMLFAFNATTGAKLWSAAAGADCDASSPAVAYGVVYVSSNALGLVAYNATTSAKLWSTPGGGGGVPVIANGVVYIGGQTIEAVNATSGAVLWEPGGCCESFWPVVADGVVYGTDPTVGSLNAYALPLRGAALTLTPAFPDDFPVVLDGSSFLPMTFTVTNFGTNATTAMTDTITGADPTQFHITADTCAGRVLAGGASCTVGVSFAPTLPAVRTAILTVHAASGGSVATALSGTGNPLTIAPGFKDYGTRLDGTTSPPTTFTVTNRSATTVKPNIASLAGSGFTATSDTCTGATLAAHATCNITVAFAPSRANSYDTRYNASISASATPGVTTTASLSGTGTPLAIAPPTKNYGTVRVGSSATATFTITNVSAASLEEPFAPSTVNGAGFSIASDTCNGTALAANASCTVTVTFTPTVAGTTYHGQLTVPDIGGYGADLTKATAMLVGTGG